GGMCPISQRKFKKDITYLSLDDRQRLNDELMSFPLATYRYKTEGESERPHLGFIIDDVAPSNAVAPNGERVDMYGYTTMTDGAPLCRRCRRRWNGDRLQSVDPRGLHRPKRLEACDRARPRGREGREALCRQDQDAQSRRCRRDDGYRLDDADRAAEARPQNS